jgi:hypothetical protein
MRTIGRRYFGKRPNYAARCDYCDVRWHRDEMRTDANGFLACPDDQEGRTEMDLQLSGLTRSPGVVLGPTVTPSPTPSVPTPSVLGIGDFLEDMTPLVSDQAFGLFGNQPPSLKFWLSGPADPELITPANVYVTAEDGAGGSTSAPDGLIVPLVLGDDNASFVFAMAAPFVQAQTVGHDVDYVFNATLAHYTLHVVNLVSPSLLLRWQLWDDEDWS